MRLSGQTEVYTEEEMQKITDFSDLIVAFSTDEDEIGIELVSDYESFGSNCGKEFKSLFEVISDLRYLGFYYTVKNIKTKKYLDLE